MSLGINGTKDHYSSGDAGCAIRRTLEAECAVVNCTFSLLAPDIPSTLDGGAILPFADRGTSTARLKFVGSVQAFEITGEIARAGNRSCGETHGAKLNGAQCACTFLLPNAGGLGVGVGFLAAVLVR